MGIETMVFVAIAAQVGSTVLKAQAANKQAKRESAAVVEQARLQMSNESKLIRSKADRARSSFISSGLTLEGTANTSIGGIYTSGLEDLNRIETNANTTSRNIMAKARSDAILAFADTATSIAGGMSSGFGGGSSGTISAGRTPVPGVNGSGIPAGGFAGATGIPFAGATGVPAYSSPRL